MSKKEASENKMKRKRKKRHGCLKSCCISFVVCLILVVAVGAGGYYLGNKYLTEHYGVTLGQVFDVLKNVRSSNEKKIVTNKFSDADLESAEGSIKSALFLKEDADVSVEELVDIVFESDDDELSQAASYLSTLAEGEPAPTEDDSVKGRLVRYLEETLVYDNIDRERLRAYDGENIDEYMLDLTDKELASLLQFVIGRAMTSDNVVKAVNDSLKGTGISASDLRLEDNLSLKQIIFDSSDGVSRVRLTLCFNLHKVLTLATDSLDYDGITGSSSAGKGLKLGVAVFRPILKAILPKKIFITADVSLKEGEEAEFYINNMDDKDMDFVYDLVKKVSGDVGKAVDLNEMINKPFMEGGKVFDILKKTNERVNLNSAVNTGKINLDLVQVGIDALKLNYEKDENGESVLKDPSKIITSHDIYNGLSVIYGTNVDDVLGVDGSKTEFDYNNIKILFDGDGNLLLDGDGLPRYEYVYQYDALLIDEGKDIMSQYEEAFLQEMRSCYGLVSTATFDGIIEIFAGLKEAENDALELFDGEKLKQIIQQGSRGGVISDTMLAAIVNDRIEDFLGEKAELADMLSLRYLILSSEEERTFAELGIYLKTKDLLGEKSESSYADIVANILPEGFVISCVLDVTLTATEYEPSVIRINDSARTADIIDCFDALGLLGEDDNGKVISLSDYINDMLAPVRDTLKQMSETLPGLRLGSSKLMLPDVFDALATFINSDKPEEERIDSALLAESLRIMVAEAEENPYSALTEADFDRYGLALINELNETLAIKKFDRTGNAYSLGDIIEMLGLKGEAAEIDIMELIDTAQLESIIDASQIQKALFTDSQSSSDMLAAMIRELIGDFITEDVAEFFTAENVLGVKVERDSDRTFLTVIAEINVGAVLEGANEENGEISEFILKLLPQRILMSFRTDVSEGDSFEETKIEYNFNENSDKVFELMEKMGVELPISSVEESVRSAVAEMRSNDTLRVSLVDGGLETDNIFAILNQAAFESDLTDAQIKSVLKAVYRSSDAKIDTYYEDNDIDRLQPADDYSGFLQEVRQKYFIKPELNSFDEVFEIVSPEKDTLHPTTFDLDELKHTPLTIEQLKPVMLYSEMGALFNEKLAGELALSSFKCINDGEGNVMELYAQLDLSTYISDEALMQLITVSNLIISVRIDMAEVITDGEGSYYRTQCNINNMTDEELEHLSALLLKYNPEFEAEIEGAAVNAGRAAYDAFAQLDANLGGNYSFTDSGLKIGDIFGFIGLEMLGDTVDHDEQANKVKKTLQGMFSKPQDGGSEYNYNESQIIFNEIDTSFPQLSLESARAGFTDRQLGAYTQAILMSKDNDEVNRLMQFSILPSVHVGEKVSDDIDYINGFRPDTITEGDYVLLTDRVRLSDVLEVSDRIVDLMPTEIYISFVLKFDQNKFEYVPFFRINALDLDSEEVLLEIMGSSIETLEEFVEENAKDCIDPVNDLFGNIAEMAGPVSISHRFAEVTDATTCRGRYYVTVD